MCGIPVITIMQFQFDPVGQGDMGRLIQNLQRRHQKQGTDEAANEWADADDQQAIGRSELGENHGQSMQRQVCGIKKRHCGYQQHTPTTVG
jgi:hypothetical protein